MGCYDLICKFPSGLLSNGPSGVYCTKVMLIILASKLPAIIFRFAIADFRHYFTEKTMRTIAVFASLILAACGNNSNAYMAKLLNEKKVLEDSLPIVHGLEAIYMDSAKILLHAEKDSTVWAPYVKKSTQCLFDGKHIEERIKQLSFSIDSLSKMK